MGTELTAKKCCATCISLGVALIPSGGSVEVAPRNRLMGLESDWPRDPVSEAALDWRASSRSIPCIEVAADEGNKASNASSASGSPICLHLEPRQGKVNPVGQSEVQNGY